MRAPTPGTFDEALRRRGRAAIKAAPTHPLPRSLRGGGFIYHPQFFPLSHKLIAFSP